MHPPHPIRPKSAWLRAYCGLNADSAFVDTNADPSDLVDNNPLGKIPTLIDDEGRSYYDSRTIMQFIDHKSGRQLYPRNADKRLDVITFEALCDGVTDCLLAIVYERRFRPEDMVYDPWIERQWSKVERALDHLNANLPRTTKKLHGGHFALAALIGYLDLRFEGKWERGRPKLKNWPKKFAGFFPEHDAYKPQA